MVVCDTIIRKKILNVNGIQRSCKKQMYKRAEKEQDQRDATRTGKAQEAHKWQRH